MTDGLDRPRGRYFEEFNIGDKMTSQGRTITESDIVAFAGLSGDYNPIHIDVEGRNSFTTVPMLSCLSALMAFVVVQFC